MGAIVRLDFPKGLAADLHKWSWESQADYDKKEGKPEAEEIADFKPMSEIKGPFYQSTTAIAASDLDDKNDYGISATDSPIEGFTVYGAKKQKSRKTAVSAEVAKDWNRTAEFMKTYVTANVPEMIYNTKNNIVFDAINKGGFTSGAPIFDNNSADANIPSQTANLPYDAVSWFNSAHVNKSLTSYSNIFNITTLSPTGVANGINLANAKDMYVRFAATNAKKENNSNFNNTKDVKIITSVAGAMDWETIVNSNLDPTNSNNASNPMKGKISKIIGSNLITTETMSVMFRKKGLKVFTSDPKYEYWEEKEPDKFWFRISFDYIIVVDNYRYAVSNNAPLS
ncbi:MAG: hypothetical protein WC648_05045 [Candidatus Paceibacterota bacterium]|jgi:hypothetical protein